MSSFAWTNNSNFWLQDPTFVKWINSLEQKSYYVLKKAHTIITGYLKLGKKWFKFIKILKLFDIVKRKPIMSNKI